MKTGLGSQAYTIIEVMIVLAVSVVLLASALSVVGSQSQRTQFTQGINDIRTQINDIINNVSTGYYSNSNNFTCSGTPTGPNIINGVNNQGTNGGCTFIGRAVQFKVNGDNRQFDIYNLVGLQFAGGGPSGSAPASLAEAMPVAIAPSANAVHSLVPIGQVLQQLSYGLQVVSMHYVDGLGPHTTAAVAFISSFNQSDSSGNLISGSKVASLWAIQPTDIPTGANSPTLVNFLDNSGNYASANSVTVCFSGPTNQYGLLTIGSNGRQLTTKLDVYGTLSQANGQCS
ncbi:MAG TPA: type II secretion system protein [Patescibacteria group bacterium]|nr:type II secretion system protein [Patescibacteria group bacterium]